MHTWVYRNEGKLVTLTPSERNRRRMSEAFIAAHGVEVADIIMEQLPPEGWSNFARRSDLAEQALLFRSDLDAATREVKREIVGVRDDLRAEISNLRDDLRAEISEVREELRGEIAGSRVEFRAEISGVRGELVGLRSELTGLRQEMNDGFRSQLKWMVGTMLTLFVGSTTLISTLLVSIK